MARTPTGRAQRALLDSLTLLQPMPRGSTVHQLWMRGVRAERIRDVNRRRDTAILYLHGGAYCTLEPRSFRALAARLSRGAQADV